MTRILRGPRFVALIGMTTLITGASVASFTESYRALFIWAIHHGMAGFWAAIWPMQVDTFIGIGELTLFVAVLDRWSIRSRIPAWLITLTGLAVSVAANIGHVHGHAFTTRGTAAIPPLAAASALAIGLGVLKRIVASAPVKPASQRARSGKAEMRQWARDSGYDVSDRGRIPTEIEAAYLDTMQNSSNGQRPQSMQVT